MAEQVVQLDGRMAGKIVELIRRKDMATVRTTKRKSEWQLRAAQMRKDLAWVMERVKWMGLGVLMGLFIAWVWR